MCCGGEEGGARQSDRPRFPQLPYLLQGSVTYAGEGRSVCVHFPVTSVGLGSRTLHCVSCTSFLKCFFAISGIVLGFSLAHRS